MPFELISDEELQQIEAGETRGGWISDDTKELLQAYDDLQAGKAFRMPIPEGKDAEAFRRSVNAKLKNHGRNDREVRIIEQTGQKPSFLKVKKGTKVRK